MTILLLSGLSILLTALGASAAVTASNTVFKEDFEGEDPHLFIPWASNVSAQNAAVNFAGVSDERAFTGKKSFKLDVTLNGGSYYYYQIPLTIPFWAPLRLSGHLWTQETSGPAPQVMLGYNWAMPSVGESGYTVTAQKISQDQNNWQTWTSDLSAFVGASDTAYLGGLVIYVYAPTGGFKNTHVVVYVDDIELQGTLPVDFKQELDRRLRALDDANRQDKLRSARRLRQQANEVLAQITPVTAKKLSSWASTLQNHLKAFIMQSSAQVAKDADVLATSPENADAVKRLQNALPLLSVAVRSQKALPAYAAHHGSQPYYTSIANPVQDLRILPDSFPLAAVPGTELNINAAPDEYEPASFVISALQDLKQVKLQFPPLRRADGKTSTHVPSIDARLVKVWWQAGLDHDDVKHPQLTPELLLRDDSFVSVNLDPGSHQNTLKNPQEPRDAAILQPVDIAAETHQQFWLTAHVPRGTEAGIYETKITVIPANAAPMEMTLRINIYPFTLEPSPMENAIYYRGYLSPDGKPHISSDLKSEQQFRAELRDMKAHGVTLPSCYTPFIAQPDGTLDFSLLQRVMDIYRQEGLTQGPIVLMTPIPFDFLGKSEDEKKQQLQTVKRMAVELEAFREKHNYPAFAVYGIDEARGERLRSEKEAFHIINQAGGMVAAAVGPGYYAAAGEWINRPIIARGQKEIYSTVHARGNKVWIYGRPMVGIEAPEVYRRSYGLMLWKRGEDGACPYAYQATDGSESSKLYDDFSSPSYRSMNFTYPTIDGVLDTVQWEGHREGIDDTRYLATFQKSIAVASKGKNKNRAKLAKDAENWLSQVDIEGDLQEIRREMAQWIVKLQF